MQKKVTPTLVSDESPGEAPDEEKPTRLTPEEKRLGKTLKKNVRLTAAELAAVNSKEGLVQLLSAKNVNVKKALIKLRYEQHLELLQMELVKLQRTVQLNGRRIAIIFEGRDAAGKGGTIRRFIEHLNPRSARVVALPKPTEIQKGQWLVTKQWEKWNYAIIQSDKITVSKLIPGEDENSFKSHPINEFHEDYLIPVNDVIKIYRIVKIKREPRF